ncbi:MAG: hypothetical protein ACYDGR_15755 [Candidatus Dormibacteria bacterium]
MSLDHLPSLGGGGAWVEGDIAAIRRWGKAHADAYAGVFGANDHVYVELAQNPVGNLRAVRQLVSEPDRIRAVAAQYSLAAITAGMDRLSHDHAALAARGIHLSLWGADEYHNRLNVGVTDQDQGVAAYLRAHYGGEMVSISQGTRICAV